MKKSRLSVSVIFRHKMTNRGGFTANRAIRAPRQRDAPHARVEEMQRKEFSVRRRGGPAQDLERLGCLQRADDSGGGAEDAGLGAVGNDVLGRRLVKETAIARRRSRLHREDLPFKAQDAAENKRNAQKYGGIVGQELRSEVIRGFDDEIVAAQIAGRVRRIQAIVDGLDFDVRVELDEMPRGSEGLGLADVGGVVEDLALEIREIQPIAVNEADVPDTGRGQIQQCRRPEAPGTDDEDPGRLKAFLAGAADLFKKDVPRVAAEFFPEKQTRLVMDDLLLEDGLDFHGQVAQEFVAGAFRFLGGGYGVRLVAVFFQSGGGQNGGVFHDVVIALVGLYE